MFNHELYASAFARGVELMGVAGATRDQQKAALRALVALAELSAASLRLYEGVLSVDDIAIPDNVPHIGTLTRRLQVHRVSELMVGRQSEPAELLALLRGLAAEPGAGLSIKERLRDAKSKRIMVILDQAGAPQPRARSVTQAFEIADIETAGRKDAAEKVARRTPTRGKKDQVDRDEVLADWNAMYEESTEGPVPGQPGVQIDMGEEMPAEPAQSVGEERGTAGQVDRGTGREASPPETAVPQGPFEAALSAVVLDPYGHRLLDRLTLLTEQIAVAMREDRPEEGLRALALLIDLEPGAPDGTPRNSYGIVLKRILARDVLAQIAPCLLNTALIEAGGKAMRRARAEGAEVLLGLLATAEGMRERRAYMTVLRSIPEATEKVIAMLGHHQWFVVRNIAELLGDLRVENAVPDLGRVLTHHDQRVRRAAAIALAKIGSVGTVEPLRKMLKDGTPEVRSAIAASVGGNHARALAMPLVALADAETSPDVLREYCRALGRIGTPEAVQGLASMAAPGGKLLNRKLATTRLAAIDGLRIAKAAAVLQSLTTDGDKAVREAAAAAVREAGKSLPP